MVFVIGGRVHEHFDVASFEVYHSVNLDALSHSRAMHFGIWNYLNSKQFLILGFHAHPHGRRVVG